MMVVVVVALMTGVILLFYGLLVRLGFAPVRTKKDVVVKLVTDAQEKVQTSQARWPQVSSSGSSSSSSSSSSNRA